MTVIGHVAHTFQTGTLVDALAKMLQRFIRLGQKAAGLAEQLLLHLSACLRTGVAHLADGVAQARHVAHDGGGVVLGGHVGHGPGLDGGGFGVGLIHDLAAGLQLRPGKDAEFLKQVNGLFRRQAGHGGDHAGQIGQAAPCSLRDPLGAVAVAVEDDPAVLPQILRDDAVGVGGKIGARFQNVRRLTQGLCYDSVEDGVGIGDAV